MLRVGKPINHDELEDTLNRHEKAGEDIINILSIDNVAESATQYFVIYRTQIPRDVVKLREAPGTGSNLYGY